jgi:hypothetical protein
MNNTKFWVSVWLNGVLFTGEATMFSDIIDSLNCLFKKFGKSTRYLPVLLSYREMCPSLGPSAWYTYKKCIHFWPFWRKGAVFNKYLWSIHAYVFAKDKFRRKNQISTVQNHIEFLRCTYFCFLQRSPQKNNCKSTYKSHVGFLISKFCVCAILLWLYTSPECIKHVYTSP